MVKEVPVTDSSQSSEQSASSALESVEITVSDPLKAEDQGSPPLSARRERSRYHRSEDGLGAARDHHLWH